MIQHQLKVPGAIMELLNAIEGLQAKARTLESNTDHLLSQLRHRNRSVKSTDQSPESLAKQLEQSFLRPSTSFDEVWLNRLQQ